MKPSLQVLLSVNGGYVDTAGFLALHGLFTTHVTGNFVTLGAALVQGTSGAVAKPNSSAPSSVASSIVIRATLMPISLLVL